MSVSLNKFSNNLPSEVVDLLSTISKEGFVLTLVGGAVRDFFLDQSISKDLDFEIRHEGDFSGKEWLKKLSDLGHKLRDIYKYDLEELRFSILRIKVGEYEVEISSPRVEAYPDDMTSFGHSDFKISFGSRFSYVESFRRRDFTLNALGIEFGKENFELVDPYNGLRDLNNKNLCPISDDFYKDPVRYLRTLRFQVSKGFNLSRELKDNLVYFNLEKLSLHYFVQEGRKIGLETLVEQMNFTCRKFAVKLPKWAMHFEKIKNIANNILELNDLVFDCSSYFLESELLELSSNLNVKKSVVRNFILIHKVSQIDLDSLIKNVKKNSFNDIQDDKDLLLLTKVKTLSSIEDKYISKIDKKIIIIGHSNLDGELEFKELSKTVNPKFRSSLGIYCHLRIK